MAKVWEEIIGWAGAISVLLAYSLLGFKILTTENSLYLILNFVGAGGLCFISLKRKIYFITAFYLIWTIIGLIEFISHLA